VGAAISRRGRSSRERESACQFDNSTSTSRGTDSLLSSSFHFPLLPPYSLSCTFYFSLSACRASAANTTSLGLAARYSTYACLRYIRLSLEYVRSACRVRAECAPTLARTPAHSTRGKYKICLFIKKRGCGGARKARFPPPRPNCNCNSWGGTLAVSVGTVESTTRLLALPLPRQ
jgi:hypothetical protein